MDYCVTAGGRSPASHFARNYKEQAMLSDVLAESLDDIVYYQKMYPHIYDRHASKIKRIKRLMRGLLAELDTPPESPRIPPQPHDGYHGEEQDPLRPTTGNPGYGFTDSEADRDYTGFDPWSEGL